MIGRLIALIITWIFLWGELSVANVASGVVVGLLIMLLFPSATSAHHRLHPLGAVKFVARLVGDLFTSSWAVVVTVLRPTPERLQTHVVTAQLATNSPFIASLVANSLTLTPGSMTVSVDEETFTLKVHVLGAVDEAVFVRQVRSLEERISRAISVKPEESKDAS
jgi:multicomponent Na+:H+ antiporter subunit E